MIPTLNLGSSNWFERKDLIIRPVDKIGGIVVLDKKDYHVEITRILSDIETYVRLPKNPISDFKRALVDLIDMGFQLGILDKKEKSCLVPVRPHIPIIYYLPKAHKDAIHLPG